MKVLLYLKKKDLDLVEPNENFSDYGESIYQSKNKE